MTPRRGIALLMLGALLVLGVRTVVGTVGETRGGSVLWHPAPGSTDLAGERQVPMRAEVRPLPGSTVQVGQIVRFPVRTSRPGYAAPLRPQSRRRLPRRRRQPAGRGRAVAADAGRAQRRHRRPCTGRPDPRRPRGDGAATRWGGPARCPGRGSAVGACGGPALVADGGANACRRSGMSAGPGEGRFRGARRRARTSVRRGEGTSARTPCVPCVE